MSNFITIYCICTSLLINTAAGHPIDKVSADNQPDLKDEIHYPNGTVVGKYSYKDHEGNPINVKYYADKTSYGVELNSFKFLKANDSIHSKPNISMDFIKPMEPIMDLASEILGFSKESINKPNNTKKGEIKNITPPSNAKVTKINSPDYETFYQNEVKAPKQCEKEKVKVYLVKEKRKTRSLMLDDNDASEYCKRFN